MCRAWGGISPKLRFLILSCPLPHASLVQFLLQGLAGCHVGVHLKATRAMTTANTPPVITHKTNVIASNALINSVNWYGSMSVSC